jgi:hypothetical protein
VFPRVCPSDVYDDPNVGTVWELPCEVPYCFMQYMRDAARSRHCMAECPIMQTAVAVYGDQNGQPKPLTSSIDWECLACRCGENALVEDALESGPLGPRCVHCLGICYCADRTFERVKVRRTDTGFRIVKASGESRQTTMCSAGVTSGKEEMNDNKMSK